MVKRTVVPLGAFLLGSGLIAAIYFGILTWGQGWDSAMSQFVYNRWYIVPIWIGFGLQAALHTILRFRLFVPTTATFLTRYQRPFLLLGLGMNLVGILAMLRILYRERRKVLPVPQFKPVPETK